MSVTWRAGIVTRMDETSPASTTAPLDDWLAALAQPNGAPGGGAACGVILALSAGLLHMVAEYTRDPRATPIAARVTDARAAALRAAEADGERSADFGAALALAQDDPQRDDRVARSALAASESSVALGDVGSGIVPDLDVLAEVANPAVRADLAIAADALALGISGAAINLRADLRLARRHGADSTACDALDRDADRLDAACAAASDVARRVRAQLAG